MASVHKPRTRESKYWIAAWRDSTGRQHVRSTKQTDRAAALTFALECERAEKHATAGTLTEAQAREIIKDILERTQPGETLRVPNTATWLREWLTSKEASKAETTMARYRQVINEFIDYLGVRANRPLVAITARDIQGFIDFRAKQKVSASTLNVDGKTLKAAFNRARKLGIITDNPAEAVELPARQSIQRDVFSPHELKLLVAAADAEWKSLLLIGYYTGARLSECCRVDWQDVDFSKGVFVFPKTKTGQRSLPLHPELSDYLQKLAPQKCGPVMPHLSTVRTSGRRGLSQHFLLLMEKAGLDAKEVAGSGIRKLHKRTFHSLRHSFASGLANADVSPELRMKLTGHKSLAVHEIYTHHELETLSEALKKLPSVEK